MPPPADHIAVIIVTFQSAAHLRACIESLPNAAPRHQLHLIIIDNASTDGSAELATQLTADLSEDRVRCSCLANQRNLGFTCAVNQGLELVGSNATVLFLNPDTILPPGALQRLLRKLNESPDTGVVAPQLLYPARANGIDQSAVQPHAAESAGEVQPSCRRFPRRTDVLLEILGLSRLFPSSQRWNRWKMGDFDHRTAREVDQPQGACLLARSEVVEQVGKWDERFPLFFSDVDWCRRVWQAGWKIRFEPEVQVYHFKGASVEKIRPRAIRSSHLSFWRYFHKYRSGWRDAVADWLIAPPLVFTALLRMIAQLFARQR